VSNVIEVKDITVYYRERDIIKKMMGSRGKSGIEGISFGVKRGEIFSIIGLNGAGKTSTMKSMLGLLKTDRGEVRIFGKKELKGEDYKKIGYLPEISYYPQTLKLKDVLNYYGELYEIPKGKRKEISERLAKDLGIHERMNDRLEKFSKGMLQKVGLAQAIMGEPEVLFLDEPMSGLDPMARKKVIDIMKDLKKKNTTIIFNTHILNDVSNLADRVAIIHDGRLIEVKDVRALREKDGESFSLEKYFIERIGGKSLD
jgi:ABC-2 type transport system ATP-binding protein